MEKAKGTMTLSLFTLCLLNATKEALYLLLAPFFPKQMELKDIPEKYYAPMFVYVKPFIILIIF